MAETIGKIEGLPSALREPAQRYADLVRAMAGGNATALAFYGMAVADDGVPTRQAARSVLVVQRVELDLLRKLGDQGARLGKAGIAAPLVMTPEYIANSCDTFPLELLEIQQHHVMIFGEDCFRELTFAGEHLRMQCERELKAALMGMHQGLLRAAGRDRWLHPLTLDAAEGLLRVLRGILWLRGIREARRSADTVREVENAVGRKLPGINAALDVSQTHGWDTFRLLYDDVAALGSFVDEW